MEHATILLAENSTPNLSSCVESPEIPSPTAPGPSVPPATTYPAERYRRLARRAACGFVTSLALFMLSGFLAVNVPQAPEMPIRIAIPLTMLGMLISLGVGLVATIRWLRKRGAEPPALPHQRPSQHQAAFWFLLVFISLGLLTAVLDRQIQRNFSLPGIGRAYGNLSCILGLIISSTLLARTKNLRFLLLVMLALMTLGYWIWIYNRM